MFRSALARFRATFSRRRLDSEFDEEVREHLDLLAQRFVQRGMDPVDAFYAARRQFGGVTQVKEDLREKRALPPFDIVVQDVRHAFRQLRKTKGFTASAALTLAVGIGASTAVFAVVDAVILNPLSYKDPSRIMDFRSIDRRGAPHPSPLSYPTFFDFRLQNRVFEHLVSYRDSQFTLTDSMPAIQVPGEIVSWDMFPMLGIRPELGRGFLPEEENPGRYAVVLSHELWISRFGGDRTIAGRIIHINGHPFTVAAVAPPGFRLPADLPDTKLWASLAEDASGSEYTPLTRQRGARTINAIGRLRPGVSLERARAEMDRIAAALARIYPDENKNIATTLIRPELERLVGRSRKPLWTLLGAVILVLLIACANVANLLLARGTDRAREFALRTALGASRPAIVRQVLFESLALGLLGTAGGILLARVALRAILPLAGATIPRIADAAVNGPVLAFSAILALVTSVLFSLPPAFQAARTDLTGTLKQSVSNIARGHNAFRQGLVIGQITLGLVLLAGAEVLVGSFMHLTQRDPGFRTDHLLTFGVGLSETDYTTSRQIAFSDALLERLRSTPGVRGAATGMPLPLEGDQMSVSFDIEQHRVPPPERPHANIAIVTPGFFSVMGIPLLKGRDFTELDDNNNAPPVLIVNQAFARKYFPGQDAIGKRIEPGATNGKGKTKMRQIVGVVANAWQEALSDEPYPIYYFPYKQLTWGVGTVVMRTSLPPLKLEPAAQAAVASLDRQAPLFEVRTGDRLASMAIARPRFHMTLMGTFAGVALCLTIFGLYGVLSYTVARRRREIGVRVALGAGRREVLGLVLREAARLLAVGLVLGLIGAFSGARLLESMVYGIRPADPRILALACGLMIVTAFAAAYIPALRAASVDPMQALRSE